MYFRYSEGMSHRLLLRRITRLWVLDTTFPIHIAGDWYWDHSQPIQVERSGGHRHLLVGVVPTIRMDRYQYILDNKSKYVKTKTLEFRYRTSKSVSKICLEILLQSPDAIRLLYVISMTLKYLIMRQNGFCTNVCTTIPDLLYFNRRISH